MLQSLLMWVSGLLFIKASASAMNAGSVSSVTRWFPARAFRALFRLHFAFLDPTKVGCSRRVEVPLHTMLWRSSVICSLFNRLRASCIPLSAPTKFVLLSDQMCAGLPLLDTILCIAIMYAPFQGNGQSLCELTAHVVIHVKSTPFRFPVFRLHSTKIGSK